MAKLRDVANSIRGTNNGASRRSFDIMFDAKEDFERVWNSGAINAAAIGALYNQNPRDIEIFDYPPANAIKIVMPRRVMSGSPDDTDVDGKQQHAPILEIEVP